MSETAATASARLICADVIDGLRMLDAESVQTVVTSPPYWSQRDYGVAVQIGMEPTVEAYVETMVNVFREVRRVLRRDGTVWLNIGDSYAGSGRGGNPVDSVHQKQRTNAGSVGNLRDTRNIGLAAKQLMLIPARVALSLQADGWYVRSEILWAKLNPMPESVRDRPTVAHEHIWLLSREPRYYYDAEAIRTPAKSSTVERLSQDIESQTGSFRANGGAKSNGAMKAVGRRDKQRGHGRVHAEFNGRWDAMPKAEQMAMGANARTVWEIATAGWAGAHFATFPPEIPRRCILAGSREGDTVLDPFLGSGTTAMVALRLGRQAVGIDINPEYIELARGRISGDAPLLNRVEVAS